MEGIDTAPVHIRRPQSLKDVDANVHFVRTVEYPNQMTSLRSDVNVEQEPRPKKRRRKTDVAGLSEDADLENNELERMCAVLCAFR